jgi:hypothetical protein
MSEAEARGQGIPRDRRLADQPVTLRCFEYAHAVQTLNASIDRADRRQVLESHAGPRAIVFVSLPLSG